MELICEAQNYEWGKPGKDSLVAEFLKCSNPEKEVSLENPYAELWMGCHPTKPSKIKDDGKSLLNYIAKNPTVLGEKVVEEFGKELPFLFKVLSIDKALSIQAHPSKKLARELHEKFPEVYKDPNYKPEMAIALTPFEALCGFRPVCEIKSFLKSVPELSRLAPNLNEAGDDFHLIKLAFSSILKNSKETIQNEVKKLMNRLSKIENEQQKSYENVELLQRLNKQFPGDVGIFMVYFLNYIKLDVGEAIFLAECEPHAYISGDCIECMACSDNVVRAGLTPKFIDVDTLISMLTYQCKSGQENIFLPLIEDTFTSVFKPPVPDFAVAHMKFPAILVKRSLIVRETASILIITSGKGIWKDLELSKGKVFFIPAKNEVSILLEEDMELFQAFVNV